MKAAFSWGQLFRVVPRQLNVTSRGRGRGYNTHTILPSISVPSSPPQSPNALLCKFRGLQKHKTLKEGLTVYFAITNASSGNSYDPTLFTYFSCHFSRILLRGGLTALENRDLQGEITVAILLSQGSPHCTFV